MTDNRDEAIRARAHRIWEDEGRPDGREHDHWAQASREVGEASDEAQAAAAAGIDEAPVAASPASRGKRTAGKAATGAAPAPTGKASRSTGRKRPAAD